MEVLSNTSRSANILSPDVDGDTDSEDASRDAGPVKRKRRSALACQRCKSRKQKCIFNPLEESRPCRRCLESDTVCSFTQPSPPAIESSDTSLRLEAQIHALKERLKEYNPHDELLTLAASTESSSGRSPLNRPIAKTTNNAHDADARGEDGRGHDDMAAGVALLSLDSANELKYLRPSSGNFWTKLVSGSFKGPPSPLCASEGPLSRTRRYPIIHTAVDLPDSKTSLALYDVCYKHLQPRYCCLDWIVVKDWVINQENTVVREWNSDADLVSVRQKGTSSFFVWMIYAIGARLLQGRPTPGLNLGSADQYYTEALQHLDVVVRLHNVHNVQAYLLLVIYSIWSTDGPSAWYLVGMAMRIALEIGIHRKRPRPKGVHRYYEEIRKRTWWGLYAIDRWLSLTLGRPAAISDSDVDQELPANVSCDLHLSDDGSSAQDRPLTPQTFTSMSSAIQMIRLRQIESDILQTVHGVKAQVHHGLQPTHFRIIERLDEWKASTIVPSSSTDLSSMPYLSKQYYDLKAETAKLQVLRPFLVSAKAGDVVLVLTGSSAAEVCQLDRSLLQTYPQNGSLCFSDLHGIFLTGLTLLRVLWIDTNALHTSIAHKAVRACSTSLFIYSQHFQNAAPYRDAFEELASICLDNRTGAPDPTNYRSASTLAGALNRMEQDSVDCAALLGDGSQIQVERQAAREPGQDFSGVFTFGGQDDAGTSWPETDGLSGLFYNFDGVSHSLNTDADGGMAIANHGESLLHSMVYPQSSSITDLFNQLLGASTPWHTTDDTVSLPEIANGGVMSQNGQQNDSGFFSDTNWNLEQ